jgi:choline dehydrogenase-like flavoprotein
MTTASAQSYDLVVVGTGFASAFFLKGYLAAAPRKARVLVLERGQRYSLKWQIENRDQLARLRQDTFINTNLDKPWVHSPIFGGGSNCWWGCAPRLLPSDFRLRTLYGVGVDWPLGYEDLEPYYDEAEQVMAISGPAEAGPFPPRRPFPQPPHRLSEPDRLLEKAYPGLFFAMPTARARTPTRQRPPCCATGTCELCPVDAKFTIENELAELFEDPRVTLKLGATVAEVRHAGSQASGVVFEDAEGEQEARADLVALGANALFNPHLLLRSGLDHPLLGARLHEQMSVSVVVHLRGLDNYQGSTSLTGHGYMLYDGAHRARHGGCLIETSNLPVLRMERGRWRQRMEIKLICEDLPQEANRVELARRRPGQPRVRWQGHSEYGRRGAEAALLALPRLLGPLPVEEVVSREYNETESHILGTALMGRTPEDSIVDRDLVHQRLRNLLVLGGSAFPTSSPANPTLTIAALSLRAAARLRA